ncbi:hypothetical protein [Christiangramia crocea]|uniref:PRC-barrel domain-containing protein n=1 Tax=Christiangramia crocea TaxID=2904124 RepID=A0A9X1UYS0_9FLAO|nr:hypothetical protein [Gramella crocea]MCG9972681.1 hypothetical protein [Gramella crocea]
MTKKEKHLYQMSELKGYKINPKDPDIRGWSVKDLDNRTIGKVDNLLVNKELGKVVYVDVEVDQAIIDANHDPYAAHPDPEVHEFINKEGENHIIIPIGMVSLNRDEKYAFTESINYRTFAETKRYKSGTNISRDYEHHVLGSYERRRNHPERGLSDAELKERELRRREEARLADEKRRERELADEERLHDRPAATEEERIRREKTNLKYSSDSDRGLRDDYDEERSYRDEVRDLRPERSLDESTEWERDHSRIPDKEAYRNRKRRSVTEDFYNRKEFHDRDSR